MGVQAAVSVIITDIYGSVTIVVTAYSAVERLKETVDSTVGTRIAHLVVGGQRG